MDESYMRRCLALAERSAALGETAVGALVVHRGRVVAEGLELTRTLLDPSAHAEVVAIRAACQQARSLDLSGAVLYTTVEPCVLCAFAIRRAAIARVVFGVTAGQAGGITSPYALLADPLAGWPAPPEVVRGVLAEECGGVLQRRRRD